VIFSLPAFANDTLGNLCSNILFALDTGFHGVKPRFFRFQIRLDPSLVVPRTSAASMAEKIRENAATGTLQQ
jgi:hypothetical protein